MAGNRIICKAAVLSAMVPLLAGCAADTGSSHISSSAASESTIASTFAASESTAVNTVAEPQDQDERIAFELLIDVKEVQEHMAQGMKLLYTGEHQTIDGRDCFIFAMGTEHEDQFVREYVYGVCDNLFYSYDAVTDTWNVLGLEKP